MTTLYTCIYDFDGEREILAWSKEPWKISLACIRYHNALPGKYFAVSYTLPGNEKSTADKLYFKYLRNADKNGLPGNTKIRIHAIWGD